MAGEGAGTGEANGSEFRGEGFGARRADAGKGVDWESLLKQLVIFAQEQIERRYWRGAKKGVLPDGHDADSIASEALLEVSGSQWVDNGTAEEVAPNGRELEWKLKGAVLRLVDRLHHRKEARALQNDIDLPLRPLSNCNQGEMGSAMESLPASGRGPDEETQRNDDEARLEAWRSRVNVLLGCDERAKAVFGCMCDGVLKNREIAQELGFKEKTVRDARRRVERNLASLRRETKHG